MARVLDLTAAEAATDVLEQTDASGLLSSGHIVDAPLSTHLADGETVRYLVENNKEGLRLTDDNGERQSAPDSDYRAVALVTDRRVLFVAGRADGDETVSLPLADVLDAGTERSGFISSALVLETHDGRRFAFPSRGDLADVVETIADAAAAWSHAERLLETADAALDRTEDRLEADDHAEALAAMADAEDAWDEALGTLESVHPAAVRCLHERVAVRREAASRLRRRIRASAGASAHASALAAWRNRSYERAAAAYEDAVDAYEAGRERPGDEPSNEQLRRRLVAATSERAMLRAAPVADAETLARRATAIEDPDSAAETWECALDRYRTALELEWGTGDRRFAVDRDATREAAADAAAAAIDARVSAGQQWLAAGDELASVEGEETARRAYRRARTHVESAGDLAAEVRPDREDDVENWLRAIDDRVTGEIDPAAAAHEAPLPDESIADVRSALDDEATAADRSATAEPREGQPAETRASRSVAGQQAHDSPPRVATDEATATEDVLTDGTAPVDVAEAIDAAERAWSAPDEPPAVTDHETNGAGTAADEPPPAGAADVAEAVAGARDVDEDALRAAIRDHSRESFVALVAEVWAARGWATTVFALSDDAIYDVIAVSPDAQERLLVWACHRRHEGTIDRAVVDQVVATRDRSRGTDAATIVTSGTVPQAVSERAAQLDVALVDLAALCDLLVATDLVDSVLEEPA